ncbi:MULTISPECIES: hypothetical protein [Asticcacaulis]|uniref:hypothetical protein n=1 Tax=Asticcacaulis TaxID=76890 RepID=UPI001AE38AEC|nr:MULTISPECIES: hypothetical protein [Asticcacaulis]MBP2160540.1 hypothetical protein [Asticcacaulis solisilvae]MDR6801585.1 hypothetical protein [Asticcacaulis sp. BE141]
MSLYLEYTPGLRARRRERGLPDDHRFLVPCAGSVGDGFHFHELTPAEDGLILQVALSNLSIVTLDATIASVPADVLYRIAMDLWPGLSLPADDLLSIIEIKVLEVASGQVTRRVFAGQATPAELYIEHVEQDSRLFTAPGANVDFQYLVDFYGEKMRPHRIPTFLELCRQAYREIIQPRAQSLFPNALETMGALSILYPASVREE